LEGISTITVQEKRLTRWILERIENVVLMTERIKFGFGDAVQLAYV
jgi:hypothetical protein